MSTTEDPAAKYRSDRRPTDELLRLALANDADRDLEAYWRPIAVLQHRLPEILDCIEDLSRSSDARCRDQAATILGQGWVGEKSATDRCCEVLLRMLAKEETLDVLVAIAFALGHLRDSRAVEHLVCLSTHRDARMRYAAVSSLCGFDEPSAIAALIARSSDDDRDVRNWATFGLGSMTDIDTAAIRDALVARLGEEDDEIRGEAIRGLAKRGDLRVVAPLLKELNTLEPEILREWVLIDEAAEAVLEQATATGLPQWQPILERLATLGIGSPEQIQAALKCCSSSGQ